MTKLEKVYAVFLIVVMVVELVAIIVIPVIDVIYAERWSQLQLWFLAPWLAAVIHMFYFVLKHWEEIK